MNDSQKDIYSLKIGRFNCAVIDDGYTEYATADLLFSRAPQEKREKKLLSYNLNPRKIKCFNNCLLIENDNELILVDAGFGNLSTEFPGAENAGKLIENLKKHGHDPESIKKVVFTHYHTDHVGGALDKNGKPAFPNAVFFMNMKDWRQGISIESYGKKVLLTLDNRMEFFESEFELCTGILAIPAPGHTPGHTVIKIESDNEEFLYTSDLAAHQIHFENPGWSMAHEYDPDLAAKTRQDLFQMLSDKKIMFLGYHLRFPGLGYLHKKEEAWEWEAVNR